MSSFIAPNLDDLRKQGRDFVTANLPVRGTLLPNSPMRVMSDNSAGLAFLVLLYLQNVADNLLPDKANIDWLTRWANIFLPAGPKAASFSVGALSLGGSNGTVVLAGTQFVANTPNGAVQFETTNDAVLGPANASIPVRALTAGSISNLDPGAVLSITSGIQGANSTATVVALAGGADAETVDELRVRVLDRIQKPPMGGDADDYVAWALSCPGVTRAWCSPNEMGVGTVTLRFMCDDLRATTNPLTNGFPLQPEIEAVTAYINAVRPVTVKDFFVEAPIPEPIDFSITNIDIFDASTRAAIAASVGAMLHARAAPARAVNGVRQDAQTIYSSWVNDAIYQVPGLDHFTLAMTDHVMPHNGSLAVLGTIS